MRVNMVNFLRETVERQPDRAAIIEADRVVSYAELSARIHRAALELESAGLRPGHTVALELPNGVEYIVQTYAIWRAGGIVVPIAGELSRPEKAEILRTIAIDYWLSRSGPDPKLEVLARTQTPTGLCFAKLAPLAEHPAGFRNVDAAFIRFTSGTTGQSKGVVLSHQTISERIHAANDALQIGPDDRVLWVLSMAYHFTVSIVAYLSFGATIVLPQNNLAKAIVEACERHDVTFFYGSPTHAALLADYPSGKPLPKLRLAISTTAALDPSVGDRFQARYGVALSQALGVIEIGLPCINIEFAGRKYGSVGPVLPAYELKLVDMGLGPAHQEVFFRGPGMLDAYYRPFRSRSELLEDGWFATRDVGSLDADGCLFLRGRSKDVISVLGMKFFPYEVEAALKSHRLVAEAAVFAVRHERNGEVVRARVVLKHASEASDRLEQELRGHCFERLAHYKVPERIEFVPVLPRTASGKVLHRV